MVNNKVILKVYETDKKKLMKDCKLLFLEHHPEFKGYNITQAFMFKKLVTFYLEA